MNETNKSKLQPRYDGEVVETPPKVEEALSGPTVEELQATVAAERMRAMNAETERARLEQVLFTARPNVNTSNQTQVDPYERFSENVLTGDSRENKRVLQEAVRTDVGRGMEAVRSEVSAALQNQKAELEAQMALNNVLARYPEIQDPANQSKYAGLITKAQVDAGAQGLRLTPLQIAERAAREFRQVYGPKTSTSVPHVEGSTSPGASSIGSPNTTSAPLEKNVLEQAYGMNAGEIQPTEPESIRKITRDYVKTKNEYIRKKGTGASRIINAVTENIA